MSNVFCLTGPNGELLDPAIQATVLAKYSRSPLSAKEVLSSITSEEANKFNDKWVVKYGHNCYDSQTEVLTEDGFIPWPEISGSEKLASLNPMTGKIEYLKPLRIIKEFYNGSMYHVLAKRIDMLVTPNHKMWIWRKNNPRQRANPKYELVTASELKGRPVAYQLNGDWEGPEPEFIQVGDKSIQSNSLMEFVGFFIGDGWHDTRYHSAVCFHMRKQRKIDFLYKICENCGFVCTPHKNDKFYVTGDKIGDFFDKCYDNERNKAIPKEFLGFGPGLLRSLFEGLKNSDGSVGKFKNLSYSTTSKKLVDQISELVLKIGYSAYSNKRCNSGNASDLYTVHINKTKNRPEVNKVQYKIQDEWVTYNGFVYCAELEKNHILYIRRNGRPAWSGNSISELASVPICIEGLSIIASKFVERVQRGAYSEKSTRYQKFSSESFVTPPGAPETMKTFASRFYETYDRLFDPMMKRCAILMGKDPEDPKVLESAVVRARAFDNLRYLLPAGTGTNVACVLNLRDARDLISDLLGHSNPEFNKIGQDMLSVLLESCPTLVRHASPKIFEPKINQIAQPYRFFNHSHPSWHVHVGMHDRTDNAYDEFLKFKRNVENLYGMKWGIFCSHMDTRPEHSEVPEIFKTVRISFDMIMDYGAFRDLQRHRRCEQFVEPLTTQYGFLIPDDIKGSELEQDYTSTMESVSSYSDDIMNDSDLSQYMIPLGYLHRSIFNMDLKELYYIVELRTKPQGHISYRRIAYEMYKLAKSFYPDLMKWCRAIEPTNCGKHE